MKHKNVADFTAEEKELMDTAAVICEFVHEEGGRRSGGTEMSYFPTDMKENGIKVNCSEKPNNSKLKPCPFCGGVPHMYGIRRRDYVDGEWAQAEGEEYWVKPFCLPWCYLGEVSARAFRITEGIHYKTPEAAAKAWNRRAKNEHTD